MRDMLVDLALFVVIAASVFVVVLMGVFTFLVIKYRPTVKGLLAMLGSFFYAVSPLDPVPEVLLGPIGLVDDLGIVALVIAYVIRTAKDRSPDGLVEEAKRISELSRRWLDQRDR